VYEEAMYWNHQWMIGQGRFYPLSWIETRFAFSYLKSLWEYKLLEATMLFVSGMLMILLIYLLSNSTQIAIYSLFFLPIFIQFRNDFDPHLAFGFMVESVIIKIALSGVCAFYSGKTKNKFHSIVFGIIAGALLFAGCCTYEYAFLLLPSIIIAFISGFHRANLGAPLRSLGAHKLVGAGSIIIFWGSYAIYVFGYLRTSAVAISGAYVLGISWDSIWVFLSQLLSPLPLNQISKGDFLGGASKVNYMMYIGGIIFISMFSKFMHFSKQKTDKELISSLTTFSAESKFRNLNLYLFGLSLVVAPAFLLSIQRTWWGKASIVHSYLGVLIGEYGYVVLAAALYNDWILSRAIKNLALKNKKARRK
jgi:hypothetical protein